MFSPRSEGGRLGDGGGREGAGATSTSPKFDLFFSKLLKKPVVQNYASTC